MDRDSESGEELKVPYIEIKPAAGVGEGRRINSTSFGDGLERVIDPSDRMTLLEMNKGKMYEVHAVVDIKDRKGGQRMRSETFMGYIGEKDLKELLPRTFDMEFS